MYQMNFPQASKDNFVRMENVFTNEIANFSVCFWAKFLCNVCGIFAYLNSTEPDEISVFLKDGKLKLIIDDKKGSQMLV